MSLGLMIQEDGIGRALGNRVRSSSPRGHMFSKTISWFTTVLALSVLGLACRKPVAAAPKAGDQITGPQVTQTATGQDSKGAPVEKLADQPAHVSTAAELSASKAAGERLVEPRTGQDAKGQDAPGTAGNKGTVASTPTEAANPTKGSGTLPTTAKTPAGQAAQARVYTTAGMNADKAAVGRPTGQVARSGKDQSGSLAARAKAVTPTPRPPAADAAKGLEAGPVPAKPSADQAALALVPAPEGADGGKVPVERPAGHVAPAPTAEEVNASKASLESAADHVAKGNKDQDVPAVPGEKGVESATPPSPAADTTKGSEASQATAEPPADQATQAQTTLPVEETPSKAGVESPTDQVARSAKGQSVPVTAGGKVGAVATAPAQAAKGPEALRPTSPADQAALARVATTDKDWSVRMAAVEGLTSQAVLARIATHDEDADIRRVAVGLLTDQAALARVARSDKDWSVRWSAVTRLRDRAVLAQVAESDPDADIRKLAVGKLENRAATP